MSEVSLSEMIGTLKCLLRPYLHTNVVQIDKPVYTQFCMQLTMLPAQFYFRKEN